MRRKVADQIAEILAVAGVKRFWYVRDFPSLAGTVVPRSRW
jgi:hypothetical protein